jgi:hypothetical protein
MDGDFDYSQLSRAQLEEALTRIDRHRYPVNYQKILRELEVRPADAPPAPEVLPSLMSLTGWYSMGLVSATILFEFGVAAVAALLRWAGASVPDVTSSPVVGSLVTIVAALVVYFRLIRNHPRQFGPVATGVAVVVSSFWAILTHLTPASKTISPITVLIATLTFNFTVASLVGSYHGVRGLKVPANNRWRGP